SGVIRVVGYKIISVVFVNILTFLLIILGGILFIVPGIIAIVLLRFVEPAVVLRDKSATEALTYSKDLVWHHWWYVFGMLLLFGISAYLVPYGIAFTNRIIGISGPDIDWLIYAGKLGSEALFWMGRIYFTALFIHVV
ncbi:MAG: hypothetical protein KDK30_14750, partial [Leptospiraceae bacterium]|nr:hypothetical protein [Leptospiraceae bacterium]